MPPLSPATRRVVPDTRRRDTLVAVGVGAAVLGLILYAVLSFSQGVNATGRVEGIIVSKHFTPQPEQQITFGKGGLNTRQIDGEYSFQVRMPQEDGKVYKVIVGKPDYETRQVGEPFSFYRE